MCQCVRGQPRGRADTEPTCPFRGTEDPDGSPAEGRVSVATGKVVGVTSTKTQPLSHRVDTPRKLGTATGETPEEDTPIRADNTRGDTEVDLCGRPEGQTSWTSSVHPCAGRWSCVRTRDSRCVETHRGREENFISLSRTERAS